jgi:hypothetical protein
MNNLSLTENQKQWIIVAEFYSKAGENYNRAAKDSISYACFNTAASIYENLAQDLEEKLSQ